MRLSRRDASRFTSKKTGPADGLGEEGWPARDECSAARSNDRTTNAIIMYKILGADQKEYGPISADALRQWIAEGRISGQTLAQADGSAGWKPLSEFAEFGPALAAKGAAPGSRSPVVPGSAPAVPPSNPRSGLAITSLVLGLMSFIGCSIVTGIPAIISGHIALKRSRKSPQQFGGGGLAVGGLVLGYLSLAFLPILAGLMLPALAKAKAKDKAQRISCVNNMKQIGLAARLWANDHGEKFPPDFLSMSNDLSSPKVLTCPGDGSKTKAMDWSAFGSANVSYEYLEPGIAVNGAAQAVVFQCPIHGSVGMGDGSVQMGNQRGGGRRR